MPQKKQVMEFKIQLSYDDGKTWIDVGDNTLCDSFDVAKELINLCRKSHPNVKYRIVGRELMPWCEIKEDEVKYE